MDGTAATGRAPAKSRAAKQRRRSRTRRAVAYLLAAAVLTAITALGIWLNVRYGGMPIAIGESGSVVGTTTPDASGRIRSIAANPMQPYDYEADNGRFEAQFSNKVRDDASVRLSTGKGAALFFSLAAADHVPRRVHANVIQFTPDPGIQLKYTVLDDRLKESIILLEPPKTNVLTFNFATTGLRMAKAPDGYHFYAPGGEEIFWMLRPTIESIGSVAGAASLSISGSKMRITLDKAFLDKAFYPVTIDPTVVGLSSDAAATAYTTNRKIVKTSDGRTVLFYQKGTDIVYKVSSDDGATWAAETVAANSNSAQFGVVSDGDDNIYLICIDDSAANALRFRKFTYEGSGAWTAGTQRDVEAGPDDHAYPDIFRSDTGRLWTAYRCFDGANYRLEVRYSDSSLPGWTEDGSVWSESTVAAGPTSAPRIYPTFAPYKTEPSIVFVYPSGASDGVIAWSRWTGAAWSAQETVPSVTLASPTYPTISAVSTYDNAVHVLFSNSNGINEVHRTDSTGDWSSPVAVSSNPGDAYPSATSSGGGVRVFYSSFVGANQRRLVYKNFAGTSWDANPTQLTDNSERMFDRVWTELAATPWNDTQTDRDALFRFSVGSNYFGNQIPETTNDGYPLDTPEKKASVKFVASGDSTLAAFRLYMTRAGTAPTYRVGLQTDATGYPSGNWVGGNAYVDAPNPGDGWTQFDIPDSQITSGTTYHLVAEYLGGVIDSGSYGTFSYVTPSVDSAVEVDAYDATSWSNLNGTPTYILELDGPAYSGQSIRTDATYDIDSPGERVGERFTPGSNVTPSAIEMRIARAGTPTGDLTVKVVQGSDTEVFSQTIATPSSPTSLTWLSAPISSLTLSSGQTYRVFVTAAGVDAANHYRAQLGVSGSGSPYGELTWGGTTDTATYAQTSSGWTDKTSAAANATSADIPIFGTNNDTAYVGMTDKFDYVYFDLGVAASSSIGPTWEYFDGSAWAPLTITESSDYDFTIDGNIAFDPPDDWATTALNGEGTSKYYVRITRTAGTVATTPIATQMTAVRNNSFPTTPQKYAASLPYAWTEGTSPFRVKFGSLADAPPELAKAEAHHIDRDSHETTITWLTNVPATSQIVYDTTSHAQGTYNDYAHSTALSPTLVQSHLVTISGLTSETVYYYRILTMNASGGLTVSDEHLIPPGDLTIATDLCASCHRGHTAWRTETWTDSTDTTHSGLLIRQP